MHKAVNERTYARASKLSTAFNPKIITSNLIMYSQHQRYYWELNIEKPWNYLRTILKKKSCMYIYI